MPARVPTSTAKPRHDWRVGRTREWIVQSFNRLFLRRAYERFDVSEVAERAGVGRSTLYEHFKSKESILRGSMTPVMEIFADAVRPDGDFERLVAVVEHVATHRPEAHRMLVGTAQPAIMRLQVDLVAERLRVVKPGTPESSIALTATHVAYAQLGLLHAWTEPAIEPAPARELAATFDRTTKALVAAHGLAELFAR